MAVKPIIMQPESVRAILDGRKSQTRRVLKPRGLYESHPSGVLVPIPPCPRGGLLWVKEAWRAPDIDDFYSPAELGRNALAAGYTTPWSAIRYEADGARANWEAFDCGSGRYRHTRFMPRWASRITLRITTVRVERVQEINETDAVAEGIERDVGTMGFWGASGQGLDGATRQYTNASLAFRDVWDSINARRPGCAWQDNPWIAAIAFEPIIENIDTVLAREAA